MKYSQTTAPTARLGSACLLVFLCIAWSVATVAVGADPAEKVNLDDDPNLVGWWKFDETSGTTAADSSKHGRDGVVEGEATFDGNSVAGRFGKALEFRGGDSVRIDGYKGVTGTGARTVTAWIKTKKPRGDIAFWGTPDMGGRFGFSFVRGCVGVNNGGYYYMDDSLQADTWQHVAVVVGEAELPNLYDDVTLYLDGEIARIDRIGLLDLWPIETGDQLDVLFGRGVIGALDDVRMYDRALTEEEIAELHGR